MKTVAVGERGVTWEGRPVRIRSTFPVFEGGKKGYHACITVFKAGGKVIDHKRNVPVSALKKEQT